MKFFLRAFTATLLVMHSSLAMNMMSERVSILTWNTWLGGWRVDKGPEKVVNEVKSLGTDIVFLQETHQRACVDKLVSLGEYTECQPKGYSVATLYKSSKFLEVDIDPRTQLFPKTSARHHVCQLRSITSKKMITLVNLNLDDRNYGPEVACGIKAGKLRYSTQDSVKSYELDHRVSETARLLYELETANHLSDQIVILGGDLSSPSTLDYAVNTTKCGMAGFKWPVTELMSRHKLIDAYRKVHPHVSKMPGITYSPVYNGSTLVRNVVRNQVPYPQDRRDYIYYRIGKTDHLNAVNATVYHKTPIQSASRYSFPDAVAEKAVRQNKWPSDHSALIVELHVW